MKKNNLYNSTITLELSREKDKKSSWYRIECDDFGLYIISDTFEEVLNRFKKEVKILKIILEKENKKNGLGLYPKKWYENLKNILP